jgi:hypothetical protein
LEYVRGFLRGHPVLDGNGIDECFIFIDELGPRVFISREAFLEEPGVCP